MWKVTKKTKKKQTCVTRLHDQIIKAQNKKIKKKQNAKKTPNKRLGQEIIKYVTILFELVKDYYKPKRTELFDSVSIKQSLLLTKFIDFIKDELNGDRNKILLLPEYSYHTERA